MLGETRLGADLIPGVILVIWVLVKLAESGATEELAFVLWMRLDDPLVGGIMRPLVAGKRRSVRQPQKLGERRRAVEVVASDPQQQLSLDRLAQIRNLLNEWPEQLELTRPNRHGDLVTGECDGDLRIDSDGCSMLYGDDHVDVDDVELSRLHAEISMLNELVLQLAVAGGDIVSDVSGVHGELAVDRLPRLDDHDLARSKTSG